MVYGGRMRREEIGREPIEKDEHWDWRGRGGRGCVSIWDSLIILSIFIEWLGRDFPSLILL